MESRLDSIIKQDMDITIFYFNQFLKFILSKKTRISNVLFINVKTTKILDRILYESSYGSAFGEKIVFVTNYT